MMMSQTWIKKILKVLAIVIAFVIGVMLLLIAVVGLFILIDYLDSGGYPYHYETCSLEDYGVYQGKSEEYMSDYINRFFPEKILDDYQDVRFVFRSANIDTYSFEAYLEFTFDSADAFNAHVLDATEGMIPGTFAFDEDFQEYVVYNSDTGYIHDHIQLNREYLEEDGTVSYQIGSARIAKILVNPDENRVIYIALALHDGGGTDTSFLRSYFERFDIDPKEYELYTESVGRVNVDGAS